MTAESVQASKKKKEDSIVEEVIQSLGYKSPRPEQEAVITGFLGNHDVFVCLLALRNHSATTAYL